MDPAEAPRSVHAREITVIFWSVGRTPKEDQFWGSIVLYLRRRKEQKEGA